MTITPHGSPSSAIKQRIFSPPQRRYNDETGGSFAEKIVFASYTYVFRSTSFIVYVVEGAETALNKFAYNYILVPRSKDAKAEELQGKADELIKTVTSWGLELQNEVLVFDQGFWQPSRELWQNVQKSEWRDVILEEEKKEAIIDDVIGFFDAEAVSC